MIHVAEGSTIEVAPTQHFVIERRSFAGGGAQTRVEVPSGLKHLSTIEPDASDLFGGRPKIGECFVCLHVGHFQIRFITGRPWEKVNHTVTTTVICR